MTARAAFEESLALYEELDDQPCIAMSLTNLGCVSYHEGDYETAQALAEDSLARRRRLRLERNTGGTLYLLGMVAYQHRDFRRALTFLQQSLTIRWDWRDKPSTLETLIGLAGIATAEGKALLAARLLAAVDAVCQQTGLVLHPNQSATMELLLTSIHSQLDEATLAGAWAGGQELGLEQAVREALVAESWIISATEADILPR